MMPLTESVKKRRKNREKEVGNLNNVLYRSATFLCAGVGLCTRIVNIAEEVGASLFTLSGFAIADKLLAELVKEGSFRVEDAMQRVDDTYIVI